MGVAWSIDSQRLTFLNAPPPMAIPSETSLWTINHDGSEPQVLYTFDQRFFGGALGWSPDSKQIACLCPSGDGEKPLLFDIDGNSEPQVMATVPVPWFHGFWPQWGLIDGE